uniref:Regulator of chromosome condensation n=1 Tax=Strombidium rassoulzadegani TaxID=1082188 RepID=A0A7S3CL99_9SPIT|mmetsp:Transcript_15860/g.26741  ORF Transcript_15860/g.26741 Transcript_15860/m.26741 type:complete len:211 (+) Transcript_15860:320-952(+)
MRFDNRFIFTPKPQPLIGLMGVKTNKLECGKEHVMLLTQDRQLYVWGSNEQGQLGIPKPKTRKRIEITTYLDQEELFTGLSEIDQHSSRLNNQSKQSSPKNSKQHNLNKDGLDGHPNDRGSLNRNREPEDGAQNQDLNSSPSKNIQQVNFQQSNMGGNSDKGTSGINSPVRQVQQISKHFVGIPTKVDQILGKIEDVTCGEKNSFAIVKI